MSTRHFILWSALTTAVSGAEISPDQLAFFEQKVRPLLIEHCYDCHSAQAKKIKGGLLLDSKQGWEKGGDSGEPTILPGRADESLLMQVVRHQKEDMDMPPKKPKLPEKVIADLASWIQMGAPDPRDGKVEAKRADKTWWSLQPLAKVEPPSPPNPPVGWGENPIDRFILAKLTEKNLKPNAPADARTFIRRASFDLIGLPPTPDEAIAFESEFARDSQRAVTSLIDRLLASPHYGERWARHWLDVVRFAESNGFEMNRARPNAWPYRDYVIRSFNDDKPYNRFVQEQIAGDQLGADEGTGFLVAGAWDQVKGQDPALRANQRADEMHDIVSTTSSAFLGLTVGCARCHAHKFDPVTQEDYFRIRAIFEGVQHGERELRPADASERMKKADHLRNEIARIDAALSRFQPRAQMGRRLLLDDDMPPPTAPGTAGCVQIEQPTNGKPIDYSPGTDRGQASDPGDPTRLPNLGESYRYWKAERDAKPRDFFSWNPHLTGRHRIWLSWGAWTTHAKDARYVLDEDGDANTTADQKEIALIDQSTFGDGTPAIPEQKRWSGFKDAGVHVLKPGSILILRSGKLGGPTVADSVLFEEIGDTELAQSPNSQPHLRAPVSQFANNETFDPVQAKFVRLNVSATNGGQPCIDELEVFTGGPKPANVALASSGAKATASDVYNDGALEIHQIAHLNDGKHGNAHSWISKSANKAWAQIELARPEIIQRVVWSRDRGDAKNGKTYQDRLATSYVIEVSIDGREWKAVASSADRLAIAYRERIRDIPTLSRVSSSDAGEVKKQSARRADLQRQLKEATVFPVAYLGKFEQPGATFRLHRGDPMMPREEIAPGSLSQISKPLTLAADAPEAERRLALARWITTECSPLSARVMVNRIWHYHFGTGIADTPSDLGFNGGKPTHPELINWLAKEFVARGWSVKEMHRLIMTSAAYRQSSASNPAGLAADAGSRFLWRFPSRRIEAEPLRDAILAVSGVLDLSVGGPGFDLFEANDNYVKVYKSKEEFGPDTFRRMVYQSKPRVQLDDTFGVFDAPDAGQIAPRRTSSTTPLQALNFLNSTFAMQQAGLFAARLKKEAGDDTTAQVRRAFALAYQREPRADELAASTALISKHGAQMFCRALINTSEFMTIH